ncbi:MAG TPA: hypothetical protein HA252_06210 [Candidatus Diapherotrites archaeon]|uniref:Uncharacterized protein n=1 Tax=Candidatus Iainarchaeum sp. TaxID=3101447 RepID=A0A7J4JGV1_9ARCH|nr:hypothetical protein [Candidatus Diapherotrites archaeon]
MNAFLDEARVHAPNFPGQQERGHGVNELVFVEAQAFSGKRFQGSGNGFPGLLVAVDAGNGFVDGFMDEHQMEWVSRLFKGLETPDFRCQPEKARAPKNQECLGRR